MQWLGKPGQYGFRIIHEGGHITFAKNSLRGEWTIHSLYVDPQSRGKKVATKLLRIAMRWADRKGVRLFFWVGDGSNHMPRSKLIEWYKRIGLMCEHNEDYNQCYYNPQNRRKK